MNYEGQAAIELEQLADPAEAGAYRAAITPGDVLLRLLRTLTGLLEARGFDVLTHSQVPCNDGGISLGQAVVAAAGS